MNLACMRLLVEAFAEVELEPKYHVSKYGLEEWARSFTYAIVCNLTLFL